MFTTPSKFNRFLLESSLINDVYNAMESDDYADVVLAAMKSLIGGNIMLHGSGRGKCEKTTDLYRNQGNAAFKDGDAVLALNFYNKALRFAPIKSRGLLLAYSNRSAVLFTIGHFAECLSDIETCFRLGCPPDVVDKLNKRKDSATAKLFQMKKLDKMQSCYQKFKFQIPKRNAEVPCASDDVDVVVKGGVAKITAAHDIKVGTILAAENCYVGSSDYKIFNVATLCRNCFNKSFNVIPCDGCCYIMFCSEECKQRCYEEYHSVECQIMEVMEATDFSPRTMLMVSGALKFVQTCRTWNEAIVESQCTGAKRRIVSNASQMFDVGNKLSVLTYDEDNVFIHGNMYEASFVCAKIIDSLDMLPSYFPLEPGDRVSAKRALARIMMYLALYAKPSQVFLTDLPLSRFGPTSPVKIMYHGFYPFTGKLKNSCTPNTIVTHVDSENVLIALQPIRKGTELTVSHMGHYLDIDMWGQKKNLESLNIYGRVCKCFICTGEWQTRIDILTKEQHVAYRQYNAQVGALSNETPLRHFPIMCDTLACLSSAPFSHEYVNVYKDFRALLDLL